jgi:hypothetical protein
MKTPRLYTLLALLLMAGTQSQQKDKIMNYGFWEKQQ